MVFGPVLCFSAQRKLPAMVPPASSSKLVTSNTTPPRPPVMYFPAPSAPGNAGSLVESSGYQAVLSTGPVGVMLMIVSPYLKTVSASKLKSLTVGFSNRQAVNEGIIYDHRKCITYRGGNSDILNQCPVSAIIRAFENF